MEPLDLYMIPAELLCGALDYISRVSRPTLERHIPTLLRLWDKATEPNWEEPSTPRTAREFYEREHPEIFWYVVQ